MVKNEAPFIVMLVMDMKKSRKTGAVLIYDKVKKRSETRYIVGKEIGHIEFVINEETKAEKAHILASDVNVTEEYQRKGYGRLMMNALIAYAKELKMPIKLFSLDDAIPFYKKVGFVMEKSGSGDMVYYHRRPRKHGKRKR